MRHGIGVHHAGMLPKYRRLVEQLAQAGLLKVICGTDTLGVGINVPIRTVVFTGLSKYDGVGSGCSRPGSSTRSPGAPGGPGSTPPGTVVVQAPEHVVENERALAKAGDDPKKRRKVQRKKPPEGRSTWTEQTFDRLVAAEPEPLASRMRVTHAMLLNVIARAGDPFAAMRRLLRDNHEDRRGAAPAGAGALSRATARCSPPAWSSGSTRPTTTAARSGSTEDLQLDFALNQPLSPFALAAFDAARPRGADVRPRRGVGGRGDPGGPAPGAVRAAAQGARRGGRAR